MAVSTVALVRRFFRRVRLSCPIPMEHKRQPIQRTRTHVGARPSSTSWILNASLKKKNGLCLLGCIHFILLLKPTPFTYQKRKGMQRNTRVSRSPNTSNEEEGLWAITYTRKVDFNVGISKKRENT